jgi:MFS transporter, ACS family, hexuronate transporter
MHIRSLRWWLAGLLALGTAISYLDRQNLPVAIGEIQKSIPISDSQYGLINSLFLFAYGTMYAAGGRLIDYFGTRIGYAIMIVWWSLANALHGAVSTVMGLGAARFLLGMGEGGAFPASAKAVAEWFPVRERALAFGIFNTGSSLGAIAAPPLIALVVATWSWRWSFVIAGALGLFWVVLWLRLYSVPAESRHITADERAHLERTRASETLPATGGGDNGVRWTSLFRYRQVWGLLTMKFLTDAGWFFFIFWLPKYLNDVRGLDIKAIGAYAWIPYAFAAFGSLIGGTLSSLMLRKGLTLDMSRKVPLGIAAALLPASLYIADASLGTAIVFFGLAMFGHQFWSTILQTLAADMFPSRVVGSVAGLMGCIGTYGAMIFSVVVGYVIQESGYAPAFLIAGVLHPVSFALLFVMIRRIGPVPLTLTASDARGLPGARRPG